MRYKNKDWVTQLNVSQDQLASKPKEEDTLIWALKRNLVSEEDYTLWATQTFGLPALRADFFEQKVSLKIIDDYKDLHDWHNYCFPIYHWQNILYIACLQPPEINPILKVCFVIAPYKELDKTWKNYQQRTYEIPSILGTKNSEQTNTQQPPSVKSIENKSTPEKTQKGQQQEPLDLDALDFSALDEEGDANVTHSHQPQSEVQLNNESSITQTKLDTDLGNLTTATQTFMQDKEGALAPNSEDDQSKSNETPKRTDTLTNSLPSLDEMIAKKTETTVIQAQDSQESEDVTQTHTSQVNNVEYTPVEFLTKEQVLEGLRFQTETTREETVVDHTLPNHIPEENEISPQLLAASANLETIKDSKSVVAHMFCHLKNDYNKLMWAEMNSDNQFVPKYVYGTWTMTEFSWKMPINLTQANIFKIAYNSNLPFHGLISDNPINDKYYDLWTAGKKPSFCTIYPVIYDDYCYGFIIGFSKGKEFDEIQSLKKVENLISICKEPMTKLRAS